MDHTLRTGTVCGAIANITLCALLVACGSGPRPRHPLALRKGAQRDGARAVLRLHVHDSQELVAVLRMMTVRGLNVTQAKLRSRLDAGP